MKFIALTVLCAAFSCANAESISCPEQPVQAQRDFEGQVDVALGRLGPVKTAEIGAKARTETRDLISKYPQADRVYIETMLFASLCSSIRASKLPDDEKIKRLSDAQAGVRAAMAGAPIAPTAKPRSTQPSAPKRELKQEPRKTDVPAIPPPSSQAPVAANLAAVGPVEVPFDLAWFQRAMTFNFNCSMDDKGPFKPADDLITRGDLYKMMGPHLIDRPSEVSMRGIVTGLFMERMRRRGYVFVPRYVPSQTCEMSGSDWQALRVQFRGAGLVDFVPMTTEMVPKTQQTVIQNNPWAFNVGSNAELEPKTVTTIHWVETERGRKMLVELYDPANSAAAIPPARN